MSSFTKALNTSNIKRLLNKSAVFYIMFSSLDFNEA